uniref:Transcription factor n=1 Tax=Lycoris longituba TaxID=272140 RepID=D6MKN0_9ASPA
MATFGAARKRWRPDAANGFAGSKRTKEMDSVGSKSKPCTKFFSTAGCQFGEGCHFLHFVPGGYNAVAQMTNMGNPTHAPPPPRGPMGPPPAMPDPHGPPPAVKTKMCNKFNSAEGCKFGDKCNFAHGEGELGKRIIPSRDGPMGGPPPMGAAGRMGNRFEPPPPVPPTTFGASATAKISVDSSLAGAIIGKGGVNTKHICRVTGAKLAIRDHESNANLRNIELEGTFDQINKASAMVQELIMNIRETTPMPAKPQAFAPPPTTQHRHHAGASNFKTKICDNFTKGSCTFGDRCHFAHGTGELRASGV